MIEPWYTSITLSTMFTWGVNLQRAYRTIEFLARNVVLLLGRWIGKCESDCNNKKGWRDKQHDYNVKISVLIYIYNENTDCADRNWKEEF